jgi:hypothetical protein
MITIMTVALVFVNPEDFKIKLLLTVKRMPSKNYLKVLTSV